MFKKALNCSKEYKVNLSLSLSKIFILSAAYHHFLSIFLIISLNFLSLVIELTNTGPSLIVLLFANVFKNIKLLVISSENKLVAQLKIYLINISSRASFDLAMKQIY